MLVYLNVELPFSCINEYLAIDSGGYVNEYSMHSKSVTRGVTRGVTRD